MAGRPRAGTAHDAPPDSGLRLLMAIPGSGALRWAPDPDAPAMRPLADGELRLAIRCFQLGRADWVRALRQPAGPQPRSTGGWLSVPVIGIADVIESRAAGMMVGLEMRGPVHVGTHRVLPASTLASEGFAPIDGATVGGSDICAEGYGWATDGCAGGPAAVEQVMAQLQLRDRSHVELTPRWLSLWPWPSRAALRPPITVASCCPPSQRRPIPDSSTGRQTM